MYSLMSQSLKVAVQRWSFCIFYAAFHQPRIVHSFNFYLQSRYFWKSSVSWNLMAWSFSGNLTNLGLLDSPLVKFSYLFADESSREHPPGYIFTSILPNSLILHYFPKQTSLSRHRHPLHLTFRLFLMFFVLHHRVVQGDTSRFSKNE